MWYFIKNMPSFNFSRFMGRLRPLIQGCGLLLAKWIGFSDVRANFLGIVVSLLLTSTFHLKLCVSWQTFSGNLKIKSQQCVMPWSTVLQHRENVKSGVLSKCCKDFVKVAMNSHWEYGIYRSPYTIVNSIAPCLWKWICTLWWNKKCWIKSELGDMATTV
jgi:hypothetical protein